MPRRKLIISGRLGEFSHASTENAHRVVHWISQRFLKWESTGEPLALNLASTDSAPGQAHGLLSAEKKVWDRIRGKWDGLSRYTDKIDRDTLRDNYQLVVRDIRSWIEERLTDEERVRMLAALRQQRYQKRHANSFKNRTITIRVDRDAYEAAMTGLPDGKKAQIVVQLLQRFESDEMLRSGILEKLS